MRCMSVAHPYGGGGVPSLGGMTTTWRIRKRWREREGGGVTRLSQKPCQRRGALDEAPLPRAHTHAVRRDRERRGLEVDEHEAHL